MKNLIRLIVGSLVFLLISLNAYSQFKYETILEQAFDKEPADSFFSVITVFSDEEVINKKYFHFQSNYDGKALFHDKNNSISLFTNGIKVYNGNGQEVMNGDSLTPKWDLYNSYISNWGVPFNSYIQFLPYPNDSTLVLLLHTFFSEDKEIYNTISSQVIDSVFYSVIDLEAADGRGAIIEKNVEFAYSEEHAYDHVISSVRHANGRDWWIILPQIESNRFYIYLFDPKGVQFSHVSEDGPISGSGTVSSHFNPDGSLFIKTSKYVNGEPNQCNDVYQFDRCVGEFTHIGRDFQYVDPKGSVPNPHGAFSESGRYYYMSMANTLFQYDLKVPEEGIHTPEIVVESSEFPPFNGDDPNEVGYLWISPDGQLYMFALYGSYSLNTLIYPELPAEFTEFQYKSLYPKNGSVFRAQYCRTPHLTSTVIDGSECDTLGINNELEAFFRTYQLEEEGMDVRFIDVSQVNPETWEWDFGDGNGAQQADPVHTYSEAGEYEVCLTVSNEYSEDTYCRIVEVKEQVVDVNEESYENIDISVFPNPSVGNVSYTIDGAQVHSIQIIDVLGRVVFISESLQDEGTLDLTDLSPGNYVLEFLNREQKTIRKEKLVLQ